MQEGAGVPLPRARAAPTWFGQKHPQDGGLQAEASSTRQHTSPDAKILEVLAEAVILNETLNLGRVSEGWAPAWPSRGADMDSWHLGRQAGFSTSGIHVYQT